LRSDELGLQQIEFAVTLNLSFHSLQAGDLGFGLTAQAA
jgi:hypothetical protein